MKRAYLLFAAVFVLCLGAVGVPAQVFDSSHPGTGPVTKTRHRPDGITAPVPKLIPGAHSVFLSNAGSDAGLFPHPFSGTDDRGYARFVEAMTASKRFTIASEPRDADLVLEFQLLAPMGPLGNDKSKGTTDPLPEFKLTVYDRASHYILWSLMQTIDPANLQKTHDKNFDDALDELVKRFLDLAQK